ncbi:MAG: NUDIX domain-containing protein [Acetobacteraceae bacterium]|nr:NUDIX domain-containing protein [Acetobacteraceae bacterium]
MDNSLQRHITACNNAELPGSRIALRLEGQIIGWMTPTVAAALERLAGVRRDAQGVTLLDADHLPDLGRQMAGLGFGRVRGEMFDVRANPDGPALSTIDRGALPSFGIAAAGVHLDGLVRRADGLHLWVARRAANKALDPNKFDHIVAGGIPAGYTPWDCLVKEAMEEAAMPPGLLANARPCTTITYAMERAEGLRRDILHCYEVELPNDFIPTPTDGEVAGFELWPIARALHAVRTTDAFKFNVSVVLIALFIRHGLVTGDEAARLSAALG